jgi:hypothetical protein
MADVSFISYRLTDHKGDRATVQIFAPATATLAELQALSDAVAAELDDVTGLLIESAAVNLALTLPAGIKESATANVDAEKGVNWGFDAADTDYRHTIRVPGVPSALVEGDNAVHDSGDGLAWKNIIINGDGVTPVTDRYANDLTSLLTAVVTFRS